MSDEMEALARNAFSAYNERDASVERAREFATEDAELRAVTLDQVFQLKDGYRTVFEDLDLVWDENTVEFDGASRFGETLLVRGMVRGRAKASNLDIEQPYWYLFEFALPPDVGELRITRMRVFGDFEEALAAACEEAVLTLGGDPAQFSGIWSTKDAPGP
jgi:hypothetical protein